MLKLSNWLCSYSMHNPFQNNELTKLSLKFCAAIGNWRAKYVFNMAETRPLFVYFRSFLNAVSIAYSIMIDLEYKKRIGVSAWYSNPGVQDGRCRRIHWTYATPKISLIRTCRCVDKLTSNASYKGMSSDAKRASAIDSEHFGFQRRR